EAPSSFDKLRMRVRGDDNEKTRISCRYGTRRWRRSYKHVGAELSQGQRPGRGAAGSKKRNSAPKGHDQKSVQGAERLSQWRGGGAGRRVGRRTKGRRLRPERPA